MDATRPKVLIVDDEPDVLLLMRINLEDAGFDTVLAADGERALEQVREHAPDVVVLDVMMPVLDGWGVLEALAREGTRPLTIVVSAKATPADLQRAYRLGAAEYLTKPVDMPRLLAMIPEVLGRSDEDM